MPYIEFHRWILAAVLAMARIGGAFAICPALADSMIPGVARRAAVFGFACLVIPFVKNEMPPGEPNLWMFSILAFKEAIIGFLLDIFAVGSYRITARTDIDPYEVGAFEGHHLPFGQVFLDEIAQNGIVLPQIWVQFVYPLLALVVGCHEGYRTKRIKVANFVDVDGTIQSATGRSIAADDVSRCQSCNVKRLGWRVENDGSGINGSHGTELMTRYDEFAVNLIADNAHLIAVTEVGHVLQFLASPHASSRVVGVAEQEDSALLVCTFFFEICPVHFETIGVTLCVVIQLQHTFKHLAPIVLDAGEETVVVGRQDENLLARHSERLDSH